MKKITLAIMLLAGMLSSRAATSTNWPTAGANPNTNWTACFANGTNYVFDWRWLSMSIVATGPVLIAHATNMPPTNWINTGEITITNASGGNILVMFNSLWMYSTNRPAQTNWLTLPAGNILEAGVKKNGIGTNQNNMSFLWAIFAP